MRASPQIRAHGCLRILMAEEFVIGVGDEATGNHYKLCYISFTRDGSIMVSPYFGSGSGLLSEVSIRHTEAHGLHINLTERGKTASTVAKLTHHASGNVGFSQHGKILRKIQRNSFPLATGTGKLFDLKVFNPVKFKLMGPQNPHRAYIRFTFESALPEAVVLSALWMPDDEFLGYLAPGQAGPVGPAARLRVQNRAGTILKFLISQPATSPFPNHLLVLSLQPGVAGLDSAGAMMLVGAIDNVIPADGDTAIAWMYPYSPEDPRRFELESLDYLGAHAPET